MQKILVIQQKMIGDVLVSTILCETLCKAFPDARVDYLIYESTYPVVKKKDLPYNLIFFTKEERENKQKLFQFMQRIRSEKYDILIDAYSKLESWIITGWSGAKKKISFRKGISDFLYTDLVNRHSNPQTNLGMVIEHRLKLLEPLGVDKKYFVTKPTIQITEEENIAAKKILLENGIDIHKSIIMINILGSNDTKNYPFEYMSQVVNQIGKHDAQLIFNYIPSQLAEAQALYNSVDSNTQKKIFLEVTGKNIRELLALINQCSCVIGNDGGAINMAKALRKPTFVIFSPWIEKKAWATFEDGKNHISVHLSDYKPNAFKNKTLKEIKKINRPLYQKFEPHLFQNVLEDFLLDQTKNARKTTI